MNPQPSEHESDMFPFHHPAKFEVRIAQVINLSDPVQQLYQPMVGDSRRTIQRLAR